MEDVGYGKHGADNWAGLQGGWVVRGEKEGERGERKRKGKERVKGEDSAIVRGETGRRWKMEKWRERSKK